MLDEREVMPEEVQRALKCPRDFGYCGDNPEMFKTWSLGPIIRTRDSNLREESNADALVKYLESDPTLADDWAITSANHWAVGWVDHLSYRAVEVDGVTPSRIARVLAAWNAKLADYPLADEEDHSRREYDATIENIGDAGRRFLREDAPEDWASQVFSWFWEHDQRAVEPRDGGGGYPSDEQIKEALGELGFLDDEE